MAGDPINPDPQPVEGSGPIPDKPGAPPYHVGGTMDDKYKLPAQGGNDVRQDKLGSWGGVVTYDRNGNPTNAGAREDVTRYNSEATGDRYQANQAQQRQGPQVDYSQALQDRGFQVQSRGGQQFGANLALARAMGWDSAAQKQGALQANQFYAQQQSGAAGARGPAAMALAQQNAAATNAAGQSAIAGNVAVAAANERAQATQQYNQAIAQQRAQDLQSQGLSAQQAQYQAQLEMQQRQANDQYSLGMQGIGLGHERLGYDVNAAQLNAGLQLEGIRSGHWNTQAGINEESNARTNPLSDIGAKQDVAYGLPMAPATFMPQQDTGTEHQEPLNDYRPQYGSQVAQKAADYAGGTKSSRDAQEAVGTIGSFGGNHHGSPDYVGSASKLAGLALMLSDEQAKMQARKEGATALVRAMAAPQPQPAHVAYYPRAAATDAQAMAQATQMQRALPAPQAALPAPQNPLARAMAPQQMMAASPVARQLPAPQQPMTSDTRAKTDAHIAGMAQGMRTAMDAQNGPGPMEQMAASSRGNGYGIIRDNPYGPAGTEIKQVMDAAPPATWSYKPGMGPGGRQAGPMAQDLERAGPVGQSMVYRDPQTNLLAIDRDAATRYNLAANSLNNERLNKLEGGGGNALVRATRGR